MGESTVFIPNLIQSTPYYLEDGSKTQSQIIEAKHDSGYLNDPISQHQVPNSSPGSSPFYAGNYGFIPQNNANNTHGERENVSNSPVRQKEENTQDNKRKTESFGKQNAKKPVPDPDNVQVFQEWLHIQSSFLDIPIAKLKKELIDRNVTPSAFDKLSAKGLHKYYQFSKEEAESLVGAWKVFRHLEGEENEREKTKEEIQVELRQMENTLKELIRIKIDDPKKSEVEFEMVIAARKLLLKQLAFGNKKLGTRDRSQIEVTMTQSIKENQIEIWSLHNDSENTNDFFNFGQMYKKCVSGVWIRTMKRKDLGGYITSFSLVKNKRDSDWHYLVFTGREIKMKKLPKQSKSEGVGKEREASLVFLGDDTEEVKVSVELQKYVDGIKHMGFQKGCLIANIIYEDQRSTKELETDFRKNHAFGKDLKFFIFYDQDQEVVSRFVKDSHLTITDFVREGIC
eukprot:TRINITY_DN2840_c0_g1_i2.p1 TRINITY_DN2840_c0_g1~~TRINITY_DN2840_c0_g1_i2.p1  ORF type:complete len:455 (+),score=86.83 TRINITY_DN2840_c0_g1_i2:38-1402(+)